MDGEIMDYRDDYFAGCVDLFVATFTAEPWDESWTSEVARIRIADLLAMPRRVCFVWVDGDQQTPTGLAIGNLVRLAEGFVFHLAEFCVHPDRQGQGIGRLLLRHLEEAVAGMGASSIYLSTGGAPVAFYEKLGYDEIEDWVSMSREITRPV